ncbi:hypothetical protein [Streptomyces griseofuscus]|uniref:hypothetical protein n=1 Tax=Streptomyces griseofuscus TaxID=146922 RepID=UPI0033E0D279
MSTQAPPRIVGHADPTPVELAVVVGVTADRDPESYVAFTFFRPGGGARLWYAWTEGGHALGDRLDELALAVGLDAADWLHIGDRHHRIEYRGRIRIETIPLRAALADVQAGERCLEDRRHGLQRVLDFAAVRTGRTGPVSLPRWVGYGPTLVNRTTAIHPAPEIR